MNHKALKLAQSNRNLICEDFRACGLEVHLNPPEMAPVAHFNFAMPPLEDDMFGAFADEDDDEDEDEEEGEGEAEGDEEEE